MKVIILLSLLTSLCYSGGIFVGGRIPEKDPIFTSSAPATYLYKTEKAIDSDKLDGKDSSYFAVYEDVLFATTTLRTKINEVAISTGTLVKKSGDIMTGNLVVPQVFVSTITFSDGTVLISTSGLGGGTGVGDNLGNHIATQDLKMSSFGIVAVSTITFLDGKKMITVPILATVYIAASNASTKFKVMANYVCDGVGDQVEIQQAINYVNSLGGGKVLLSPGTFYFSNVVYLDNVKNLIVEGESMYSTHIFTPQHDNFVQLPVFGPQTPGALAERIVFKNFRIVSAGIGSFFSMAFGSRLSGGQTSRVNYLVIDSVFIENFYFYVNVWNQPVYDRWSSNVYVINCDIVKLRGFNYFSPLGGSIVNCRITPHPNAGEFIALDCSMGKNIIFDGNVIDMSNVVGSPGFLSAVEVAHSSNIIVSNNILIYSTATAPSKVSGIYVWIDCYNIQIFNNTIIDNRSDRGAICLATRTEVDPWDGSPYDCRGLTISGNQIVNCKYGIKIADKSPKIYDMMIMGNQTINTVYPLMILNKAKLVGNYHIYMNSWETNILDFDRGIVAKSIIHSGNYTVGISTPTNVKQVIVDNNYDMWVSTGTENAWQWKKINQ